MKPAWMAAGLLAVLAAAWWLARDAAPRSTREQPESRGTPAAAAPRVLYRWRDADGVLQITDPPPRDRPYEAVDVDALDRRNRFDPHPPARADAR